jgi:hypothetical protein
MSAIPQARLSFQVPFINYKLPLPLSQTQVDEMSAFTETVRDTNARALEDMLETITKVAPIALAIIAAIALSPIWFPIATISSFLLGPITWIAAGVTGVAIWEVAQRISTSFYQQHPAIVTYVAAKTVSWQRREDPAGPSLIEHGSSRVYTAALA